MQWGPRAPRFEPKRHSRPVASAPRIAKPRGLSTDITNLTADKPQLFEALVVLKHRGQGLERPKRSTQTASNGVPVTWPGPRHLRCLEDLVASLGPASPVAESSKPAMQNAAFEHRQKTDWTTGFSTNLLMKEKNVTWMVARPERKQWPVPHLEKNSGFLRLGDSCSAAAIPWAPSCDLASSPLASDAFARLPSHEKSSLEDGPHLSHHSDAWIRSWSFDQWTHLVLSAPSWSAAFLMHQQFHHPWPHSAPPCSGQLPIPSPQCTTLCRCSRLGFQPNLSEGWKPQLHLLHGRRAL